MIKEIFITTATVQYLLAQCDQVSEIIHFKLKYKNCSSNFEKMSEANNVD